MAGRMLNPCICESERMWKLSCEEARLLYTWIIAWLDINGVFVGSAKKIKAKVWLIPEDDRHSAEAVEKYLQEMIDLRLIIRYEEQGQQYIWYPDFIEKQAFSQNYYEQPKYPVNEHIIKINMEIKKKKHRRREENPIPQEQPKKPKQKKPESDLIQIHSYWENIHKKKTGEFIELSDKQKGQLNKLIEVHDGKIMKCLDELYSGQYKDEHLNPADFLASFEILLNTVDQKEKK